MDGWPIPLGRVSVSWLPVVLEPCATGLPLQLQPQSLDSCLPQAAAAQSSGFSVQIRLLLRAHQALSAWQSSSNSIFTLVLINTLSMPGNCATMRDVQAVLLATTRLLKSHEDASAENILHKFMWDNTYQDVCLETVGWWLQGCEVSKS